MTKTIDAPYIVRVLTEDGEIYADYSNTDGNALIECETEDDACATFRMYEELLSNPEAYFGGVLTVQLIVDECVEAETRIEGSEL